MLSSCQVYNMASCCYHSLWVRHHRCNMTELRDTGSEIRQIEWRCSSARDQGRPLGRCIVSPGSIGLKLAKWDCHWTLSLRLRHSWSTVLFLLSLAILLASFDHCEGIRKVQQAYDYSISWQVAHQRKVRRVSFFFLLRDQLSWVFIWNRPHGFWDTACRIDIE